ncbi:MAG: ABC transporter permease [Chloroflexota bacterium]|nr:ABC transporter permease [Chloroflexota bacterium]
MVTANTRLTAVEEHRDEDGADAVSWSGGRLVLLRLLRDPRAMSGLALLLLIAALTLLAPLIARYDPNSYHDFLVIDQLPSGSHWFGTDYLGRDLWSRVLYGGRISLPLGLGVVTIEAGIGVPLGLVTGYIGGLLDDILMRLVDIELALPGLLLPLGVIAMLGPGVASTVVALGVAGIPLYARLARASTRQIRERDYITAARAIGHSNTHIVWRQVLPNILDPLIVQVTLSLGSAIVAASALSYLGVGTQPPTADWGALLNTGAEHMFEAWSEVVFPGLAISLAVLGINLCGDGLTDALNPRL